MSLTNRKNLVNYEGTGTTGPFPIPFPYLSTDDLVITMRDADWNESVLTLGDGIATIDGSGVTTTDPIPVDGRIRIERWTNPTQEVDYVENDSFPAATTEDALDKLTIATIDNFNNLSRLYRLSIRFPYFSSHRDFLLPKDLVPGGFLRINTSGDGIEFYSMAGIAFSWAEVQAAIDSAIAGLATDVSTALTEGVWHSAVGWKRDSANDSTDADLTQLTSFLIPAGLMGPNDALEVISSWTMTGVSSNRNLRGVFGTDVDGVGGTSFLNLTPTTQTHANTHTLISNRGAQDSQYGYAPTPATTAFTLNSSVTEVTSSVDTSAAQYFSFQCSWAGAISSHSIKLERYMARLIRP